MGGFSYEENTRGRTDDAAGYVVVGVVVGVAVGVAVGTGVDVGFVVGEAVGLSVGVAVRVVRSRGIAVGIVPLDVPI